MSATLRVTYKKSSIGYSQRQKDTIRSLGLRRLGQTVELPDNGAIRGMVLHVRHLVTVEEIAAPEDAVTSGAGTANGAA
jgi:large subunit ribosomal protein L30